MNDDFLERKDTMNDHLANFDRQKFIFDNDDEEYCDEFKVADDAKIAQSALNKEHPNSHFTLNKYGSQQQIIDGKKMGENNMETAHFKKQGSQNHLSQTDSNHI